MTEPDPPSPNGFRRRSAKRSYGGQVGAASLRKNKSEIFSKKGCFSEIFPKFFEKPEIIFNYARRPRRETVYLLFVNFVFFVVKCIPLAVPFSVTNSVHATIFAQRPIFCTAHGGNDLKNTKPPQTLAETRVGRLAIKYVFLTVTPKNRALFHGFQAGWEPALDLCPQNTQNDAETETEILFSALICVFCGQVRIWLTQAGQTLAFERRWNIFRA